MPKLSRSFSHSLGKEEALRRIKEKLDVERVMKSRFVTATEENWNDGHLDFSIVIYTSTVHGTLDVGEDKVDVVLDLPIVATMMTSMIDDQVKQEISGLLGGVPGAVMPS